VASYYHLASAIILQQRYPEAEAALKQAQEFSPNSPSVALGWGQLYLAKGDSGRAVEAINKQHVNAAINLFWRGAVYAAPGDSEKALATMQKTFQAGFRDFAAIDSSPYFAQVRSDQRFQKLMERYRH
jgi:tetratricopeptide (TPR) repeat protein